MTPNNKGKESYWLFQTRGIRRALAFDKKIRRRRKKKRGSHKAVVEKGREQLIGLYET